MRYRDEFRDILNLNMKLKDAAIGLKLDGRRPKTRANYIVDLSIEIYRELDRLTAAFDPPHRRYPPHPPKTNTPIKLRLIKN